MVSNAGVRRTAGKGQAYLPFEEALKLVRSRSFTSQQKYWAWIKLSEQKGLLPKACLGAIPSPATAVSHRGGVAAIRSSASVHRSSSHPSGFPLPCG